MNTRKKLFFACGIGLAAASAQAEVTFNGFATLAGGSTLSDEDRLFGYDEKFDYENNSLLALQASSDLGDGLSATAQVIARGRDQWNAKLAWAYVGYEFNDNIKLIAGRQRMPFYVFSDYLDVSYAYHWITPPEGSYALPFDSTNGIGAIITNQIGSADSTLHIVTGRIKEDLELDQLREADLSGMYSVAWTLNFSDFSLRAGYAQADLQYSIPELEQALASPDSNPVKDLVGGFALAGYDITNELLANDDDNKGTFLGFGATYDNGNWLAIAEYTEITVDHTTLPAEQVSYYFTLGKRFGDFTPHITVGADENTPNSAFLDAMPTGNAQFEGLKQLARENFFETDIAVTDNEYYTVGMRWDFHSSAAFKVDYTTHTANHQDKTNNLLRFAISTVF